MMSGRLPRRRPKIWFTADLRLGYRGGLRRTTRSFNSVEEMDHVLIVNWNEVVHPDDHVWVIGDFCAAGIGLADTYLRQLNGSKSLIIGDCDPVCVRRAHGWEYVDWFVRILLDERWVYLSHFPLCDRPTEAEGALSLFAHPHEELRGRRWSCHVGLDSWDYRPVSLAEISRRMAACPSLGLDPHLGPCPVRR